MVQSSDPSLDFQQERYKPDCLSPGQRLPLPSFLACCVKPVLLPVGSVAHRLLKYWHPHVIVFFLLLPGSIKKPVFLLTLLLSVLLFLRRKSKCLRWSNPCLLALAASDNFYKNKLPMFLRFCASRITNWVTFWSLWALRVGSYLIFVPTTAIVFVCVEVSIVGSMYLGDKGSDFKTWNGQKCTGLCLMNF